jgi:hypothetical protein
MADRHPLLLLPAPTKPGERGKRYGGGAKIHRPSGGRQSERLGPKFQELADAMEKRRLAIRATASGASPEEVIVLETVGPIEGFVTAVNKIAGLEWLGEIDEPDIPPDPDFFDTKDDEKPLHGRLYLVFASQQALGQLLSLWRMFTAGRPLEYGFGV